MTSSLSFWFIRSQLLIIDEWSMVKNLLILEKRVTSDKVGGHMKIPNDITVSPHFHGVFHIERRGFLQNNETL